MNKWLLVRLRDNLSFCKVILYRSAPYFPLSTVIMENRKIEKSGTACLILHEQGGLLSVNRAQHGTLWKESPIILILHLFTIFNNILTPIFIPLYVSKSSVNVSC